MDAQLAEAAKTGNVNELRNLVAGNPFLIRPAELSGGQNPLHISCMEGHADFVKMMLYYRLEFAKELNSEGLSPLHIASAYGHLEIVEELLKVGPHLCLVKGKDGRIPLHYAVVEGQIKVIDVLLSAYLGSIKELTAAQETCFHIAMKYGQVQALGYLISHVVSLNRIDIKYVVNKKDDQGNSFLHLAASMKEYGVLEFWLLKLQGFLSVNSLNNRSGLTTLDILESEGAPTETQNILRLSGAKKAKELPGYIFLRPWLAWQSRWHYPNISTFEAKNTMLVIAVLIVTATYQSMFNPPGGVWQDDKWPPKNNAATTDDLTPLHLAGEPVLATKSPVLYYVFVFCNSIGFFSSLMMLPHLTKGLVQRLPLKIALYALGATYFSCMFTRDVGFLAISFAVMFLANGWLYTGTSVNRIMMKFRYLPKQDGRVSDDCFQTIGPRHTVINITEG